MSLFISTENQQLLYGMIHKTPEINVFSTVEEKNVWFRSIIESFFKKMPAIMTRDNLKEVNREVLGFMLNSLRSQPSNVPPPTRLLKREQPVEAREYTAFFDLPKPKIIDFSEKIEDSVITNMDELIEQQKRLRERELQEYAPPSLVPGTGNATVVSTENIRMKILEELPKNILPLEKHVHFEDPTSSMMTRLMESLDRLNTRMEQIERKVDKLVLTDSVGFLKGIISGEVEG